MTHEQRRGDVRWKRAEQRILQMKLDQMTKQRRLAIGRAVSEPALPMIPHCLLHDAFVLMVDGTTKLVRYLDVGDKVQIAYCHRGAVLRGVSTVDSVHTNRPKRRDVTLVTSTGRGCVAMVTSDHSFLAKRAEGDFQWGPVIAGGLSRHHLGMEIEVNPHNRVQDLVGWERPVRFEQVESTREDPGPGQQGPLTVLELALPTLALLLNVYERALQVVGNFANLIEFANL
mmetsp:Transcript_30540/g.97222  ORF Transcript_30540/g.97222 Transcript_30540/m.97222 type:complete len:229 (+) Transcript_30540:1630-2316(+)